MRSWTLWRAMYCAWTLSGLASRAFAAPSTSPLDELEATLSRGTKLLQMQGCTACHSLDGARGVGPTLAGRMHQITRVLVDAQPRERVFDADYVARSLRSPDDELAVGFPAGVMPAFAFTERQLAELVATLERLPAHDETERAPHVLRLSALAVGLLAALAFVTWRRAKRRPSA